jgi:hypothetical protein
MFSKDLLLGCALMVVTSAVVAMVCFHGPTVHLPLFVALVVGIGIGWFQPRKGWILAIIQLILSIGFYFLILQNQWLTPFDADATKFTVMLQFIPVFAGSYLAAFLKRAFL